MSKQRLGKRYSLFLIVGKIRTKFTCPCFICDCHYLTGLYIQILGFILEQCHDSSLHPATREQTIYGLETR